MKKFKSIIAILLVCSLFFSVASCGKDTTDGTTTTTTEQSIAPNETVNSDATYSDTVADTSVITTATPDTTSGSAAPADTQASVTQSSGDSGQQASQTNAPESQAPQQTQSSTPPQSSSNQEIHEADGRTYYVYYPENIKSSKKTYPVLSWANGTMCPPDMYADLLSELAKGGYIVIASSETMSADGSAQIAALDFVISLNTNSSSLAYKKINTSKLGAIGHSQGGRSSVNAAVKDPRIKCVVSLAGSNFLEEAEPNSAPTLFIAGEKDMIVSPSKWIQPAYDVAKGPAVYASLNGAIHTTCCTNPEKYSSYILDWCDAWLKGDAKALSTFSSNGTFASDSNWSDFQCKGF
ncbi:MAG: hypothetical protein E7529_03055 [Ruminococcaceae bacterium]|nr:hypothetical protein [Oscillospiraceae bacterium]